MSTTVTIDYDPVWRPLDWAKLHCPSYITNDMHLDGFNLEDRPKIDYFFGDEQDAIIFALRWR